MKTQEKGSMPLIWSVKETAIYLRMSEKTVYRRCLAGFIDSFKESPSRNSRRLVYAETVIQENLNSIKPKFLKKSSK